MKWFFTNPNKTGGEDSGGVVAGNFVSEFRVHETRFTRR
jgi:hypothetical protein